MKYSSPMILALKFFYAIIPVAIHRYWPVKGGGNYQSIRSSVFEPIDRCWLWSTVTKSCLLSYVTSITASS